MDETWGKNGRSGNGGKSNGEEDERENTKDPGADSSSSLPGRGAGDKGMVESSPDPSAATALSLRRRDIEARHSGNMPSEIGDDAGSRLSIATSRIDDTSIFNARAASTFQRSFSYPFV